MTSQTHRITNCTRGKLLSEGVPAVNGTFEHLTVMRVLIEGLAESNVRGLWMTEVQGIPAVPRISPFDLIYVDKEQCVVEAVELLPAGEQPAFRAPAVSALVLPFQTISATGTQAGDQLAIECVTAGVEAVAPGTAEPEAAQDAGELAATEAESPIAAQPEPEPAAEMPLPALTVQEVVLLEDAANRAASEALLQPGANVKKLKGSRARKARRQAAQRNATQQNKEKAAGKRRPHSQPHAVSQSHPESQVPAAALASIALETHLTVPAEHPVPAEVTPPAPAGAAVSASLVPAAASPAVSAVLNTPLGGKIMAVVHRVLRWLNPNAIDVERRNSIRMPTKELTAYGGPEGEEHKLEVSNISSSGMYVRTEERWEPGTKLAFSLQRSGPPEETSERRAELEADAVRSGVDGVGLAFALPRSMKLDLWETAASGVAAQSGPEYIVHEVRVARALGLLRAICPEIVEEATKMLRKDLSSVRARDALRMLLMAEKMFLSRGDQERLRAPVKLVARILEMGSWAGEEWTQKLWAGMLVTSCSPDGSDRSNVDLVEMLSQLAPLHLRILELVASRHEEAMAAGAAQPPTFTILELTHLLDLANQTKTLRSVGEMSDRGLMTSARRSPTDPNDQYARTCVTPLGLKLYARCHGRME